MRSDNGQWDSVPANAFERRATGDVCSSSSQAIGSETALAAPRLALAHRTVALDAEPRRIASTLPRAVWRSPLPFSPRGAERGRRSGSAATSETHECKVGQHFALHSTAARQSDISVCLRTVCTCLTTLLLSPLDYFTVSSPLPPRPLLRAPYFYFRRCSSESVGGISSPRMHVNRAFSLSLERSSRVIHRVAALRTQPNNVCLLSFPLCRRKFCRTLRRGLARRPPRSPPVSWAICQVSVASISCHQLAASRNRRGNESLHHAARPDVALGRAAGCCGPIFVIYEYSG